MTVLVEEAADTQGATAVDQATSNELAHWHIRAAALAVDLVPGVAVVVTMALVWLAVPPRSLWWWASISVLVVVALATMANRAVLPATFGWSLGRALLGIKVVQRDGAAVGVGQLTLRELAHLLDTLSVFVGWLWPLRDSRRRTFADLLLHTEVRYVADGRPADIRRHTATAAGVAVLLCVAGAAVSIFAVYLPGRGSEQTRKAVSEQGPKIVAEMLTYDPKSLEHDFARARSLTTDKYRPELVKQQESVQKGQPAINEYWVTDSTVLSATSDTATMLLFMQGHRGGGPGEDRFITATVRVSLVKGNDGQWLVDNLDVVTKPKPAPVKQPTPPKEPAPPKGHK